jgi:hypothetical protein
MEQGMDPLEKMSEKVAEESVKGIGTFLGKICIPPKFDT